MRTTRRRSNRRQTPGPAAAMEASSVTQAPIEPRAARPAYVDSVTGERIVAGLIDLALTLVLGFVMSVIFSFTTTSEKGSTITGGLSGWHFWLYIALVLAYGFVCEALWGKTLGKKLTGIHVASKLNEKLTWPRAFVRNLVRPIDAIPGFYAIGLIIVLVTKRKQRLGDLLAGTIVVRDF